MDRKVAFSVKTRPITTTEVKRKVDIIIPFHGNYKVLLELVRSIYRYVGYPYKITLVDDGSPSTTFHQSFEKLPAMQYLRHEERMGFGASLHTGFKNTDNPLVLFLNSDCLVKSASWLDELVISLYKLANKNVRLVTSSMNNTCGLGPKSMKVRQGEVCEDHISDVAVPLISALAPRSLFEKIGFIKSYPNPGYEDTELFHRMDKVGFKQAVSGRSWIYHEGAVTLKSLYTNEQYAKLLDENYELCMNDLKKLV